MGKGNQISDQYPIPNIKYLIEQTHMDLKEYFYILLCLGFPHL